MMLVTGASGFVGGKIMQMCKDAVACPSLQGLCEEQIKKIVEQSNADVIIHTAAISDIGVCEANPEASYLANVQIPLWLAKAAKGKNLSVSVPTRFTALPKKTAHIQKIW